MILLTCLTLSSELNADSSNSLIVNVDKDFSQRSLGKGLLYLATQNLSAGPETVVKMPQWQISDQTTLNFGFSEKTYWVKFEIANISQTPQDLIVDVSYPFLDNLDIYVLRRDATLVQHTPLGDHLPANTRPIVHSHFLAPLVIPEQTNYLVLLRVNTLATNQIPITVWNNQQFISSSYKSTALHAAFYGLLFCIAVYHLLLYLSLREPSLLLYGGVVLSLLMVFLRLEGMPNALLWPSHTAETSDHLVMFGICGTVAFFSLFNINVLDLKSSRPRLAMICYVIFVCALVVGLLGMLLPHHKILRFGLGLGVIALAYCLIISVIRSIDKFPPARYTLTALVFVYLGVFVTILDVVGFIPAHPLTYAAGYLGMTITVFTYSFAISNRMNMARSMREEAQLQLTRDLDTKVRERTEALEIMNKELLEVSITDGLTELFNRRHFDEIYIQEFKRAYREKRSIAILLIDVDHFKKINDDFGHQFGDLCLKVVAQSIVDQIHRPPDVAARYGGEEFVVVLPSTDLDGAVHVAETIKSVIAALKVTCNELETQITASIGVAAVVPSSPDKYVHLLKSADTCLYQAKQAGRNRVEC